MVLVLVLAVIAMAGGGCKSCLSDPPADGCVVGDTRCLNDIPQRCGTGANGPTWANSLNAEPCANSEPPTVCCRARNVYHEDEGIHACVPAYLCVDDSGIVTDAAEAGQ